MKHITYAHSYEVVSELPASLAGLRRLAKNFRWTWDHPTRDLFREIDKVLWHEVGHNPVQMLALLPQAKLQRLAQDAGFCSRLDSCVADLNQYLADETWYDRTFGEAGKATCVAYFCAEFGVSESLPIYSGGLGILAGDHLKAASDLGIPLVGMGLLYARGYFRQLLNSDGWQQEQYPNYDFYEMPLELVRGADEQPIRIEVEFPDRTVTCQVWKAEVGRIPLYLLDSNVLQNAPNDQTITDTLYGGDQEMRIRQEMILGIGGMRALEALGIHPTVCHMNEGHAAFQSLERIRQFMEANSCDFRTARQVIVNGNVFTTHTIVPAGFDVFHPQLLERYVGKTVAAVNLPFSEFLKLGRIEEANEGEAFNMAVLAMETANHVNGVSKLHAEVTRGMFEARWPGYPEDEIPIEPLTNGVHTMSWVCRRMTDLYDQYLGPEWRRGVGDPAMWARLRDVPDSDLWDVREAQRADLVRFARKRLQQDLERRNAGRVDFGLISSVLDPRVLTIGFARRFATYKRATLILQDRDRLKEILFHPERPVQIVLAGKSHPKDDGGKKLIQDIVRFITQEGGRARMVFLEDYDMLVARALVQGVDVWLNNPRRPQEASGTSGMKVLANGGLNCSILDGWWDEGYRPGVGWAIGDRNEVPDSAQQDWLDSRALYTLIEQEVAPKFYHRVDGGIPTLWLEMMKDSMTNLTPVFSTARMVREYTERFYVPASRAFTSLGENGAARARQALSWRDRLRSAWSQVKLVKVSDTAATRNAVGYSFRVRAVVSLGQLSPDEIRVQALVGKVSGSRDLTQVVAKDLVAVGQEDSMLVFEGDVTCDSPGHLGYTVRIVPFNPDVSIPSEISLVCWESR